MSRLPLLIPIENQVRELDAKLLLAAHAVARGHDCYIGWKGSIDGHLNAFPRGVYFAKSLTSRNVKVLKIARALGHSIVGWDEEALVHYPPDIYYARRLDHSALELTDHLYAWGDDNKDLIEGHPQFPGTPTTVTGNPRADLLRSEIRPFFDDAVARIQEQCGSFILVNTNFGTINGYYPEMNVCYAKEGASDELEFGRGSIGFPRDFALSLFKFRYKVFEAIQAMVPKLAEAFPDRTIVLRPHPAENRDLWHELLEGHKNVQVIAEGNVVPWLLAADVLVHNSCTTAVEAYILDRPVVGYVPYEGGDDFATEPPHKLSDVSTTVDDMIAKVGALLDGSRKPARGKARDKVLHQFVSSLNGSFACERILDSVENDVRPRDVPPLQRIYGALYATGRRLVRQMRMTDGQGRYSIGFKRQRFPDVTRDGLQSKLLSLSQLTGSKPEIRITQEKPDLFRLSPG